MSDRCHLTATPQQRQELEALTRSAKRREADRARGVLWSLDGQTSAEIAQTVGVSAARVRGWRTKFKRGGVAALRAQPHLGRPPVLADLALAVVAPLLDAPLSAGPLWTVPRLQVEVQRQTGRSISAGRLGVILKKKGTGGRNARVTRSKGGKTP